MIATYRCAVLTLLLLAVVASVSELVVDKSLIQVAAVGLYVVGVLAATSNVWLSGRRGEN